MGTDPPLPLLQVLNALVALAVALLGIFGSWLSSVMRAKAKGELARTVSLKLTEIARDVVLELEQTVVPGLRKSAADGLISAAELQDLKVLALSKFKAYLGAHGKAEALVVLGYAAEAELDHLLQGKLEAEVAKVRAAAAAPVVNVASFHVPPAVVS